MVDPIIFARNLVVHCTSNFLMVCAYVLIGELYVGTRFLAFETA